MATTFLLCMPLLGVAGALCLQPGHLALHQVVRADVTYTLYGDQSEEFEGGNPGPLPHTYTLTDAPSLEQLERMLNALPALSGTPLCAQIVPKSTFATASIGLRTRSGQSFGLALNGFCGLVSTGTPSLFASPSFFGGSSYYADAGNGVLNFLRVLITPPCRGVDSACTDATLPLTTPDGHAIY